MLLPRAGRAFGLTSRRMRTQAGVPDVKSRSPLPCPPFPLPSLPFLATLALDRCLRILRLDMLGTYCLSFLLRGFLALLWVQALG